MNAEAIPLDIEKRTPKRPVLVDGSTGGLLPTTPAAQRTPLKTLEHVKRELARVYRLVKAGCLPSEEGSKRAYILVQLGKVIEAADLERRLELLERELSPRDATALSAPPVQPASD